MTLKDKILVFGLPILLGSFVTFGIGHSVYNYLERRENRILEQAKYDLKIAKPDVLIPLGDINGRQSSRLCHIRLCRRWKRK